MLSFWNASIGEVNQRITSEEPGKVTAGTDALRLKDVDLVNPDSFVTGVPHHFYKLMRREAPVYRHAEPGGPGFWALTKYDDIVTVSMDSGTFSSWQGGTNIHD